MAMPNDIPIIDCMIGFPANDFSQYEFIRKQLRDTESRDGFDFPVEYMFKNVPKELYGTENPIDVTLHEMDRFGVERGLIGAGNEVSAKALKDHPDRFIPSGNVDPNEGMEGVRNMVRQYEEFGVRAFSAFPAGCNPQVAIDDAKFYPIYAKCVELGVPIFVCAGVPGPRLPMDCQKSRAHRPRYVRLPRARIRDATWLRALGEARYETDAQVAQPLLLDLGLRPEPLPERDRQLR